MSQDYDELIDQLGRASRAAARLLSLAGIESRRAALHAAAGSVRASSSDILAANAEDLANAEAQGTAAAMLDRLRLDVERVAGIAAGLEAIAALDDPLGRILADWTRPNGLRIQRVAVPIG